MNRCLMEPSSPPNKKGRVWAVTAKQLPLKELTEQNSKIAASEGRDPSKVLLELSKFFPRWTIRHQSLAREAQFCSFLATLRQTSES